MLFGVFSFSTMQTIINVSNVLDQKARGILQETLTDHTERIPFFGYMFEKFLEYFFAFSSE